MVGIGSERARNPSRCVRGGGRTRRYGDARKANEYDQALHGARTISKRKPLEVCEDVDCVALDVDLRPDLTNGAVGVD